MTSAGSRSVSLASQQYRRVIACASLSHLAVSSTGPALPLQRRKYDVVNSQAHTLAAAVVGSSLASAERRGLNWIRAAGPSEAGS
jgi:hypothetical protein